MSILPINLRREARKKKLPCPSIHADEIDPPIDEPATTTLVLPGDKTKA